MWQNRCSKIIDTIFLHFGWVYLETSIHFSGIGNDSTLDAQSLTLESTWGPHMKSPEIQQKSFRFSSASGNESWKCSGGGGPSDSLRKSWWRSPRIGWSRVKVHFFSSWSLPENFTVPSETGNMYFSSLLGVIHSFALSLVSMVSDTSISFSSSRSTVSMSPFQIYPVYKT